MCTQQLTDYSTVLDQNETIDEKKKLNSKEKDMNIINGKASRRCCEHCGQ